MNVCDLQLQRCHHDDEKDDDEHDHDEEPIMYSKCDTCGFDTLLRKYASRSLLESWISWDHVCITYSSALAIVHY